MYKKKKKAIDKFSASLSAYNKTKLLKLIYHDLQVVKWDKIRAQQ